MKNKFKRLSLLGASFIAIGGTASITLSSCGCAKQEDAKPTVDKIEITKMPTTTEYVVGESLNLDGLEVTKVMSDSTKVKLNKGEYTTYPVDGTRLTEVEQDKVVKVELLNTKEKSVSFKVNVNAEPIPEDETIGKLNFVESGDGYAVTDVTNKSTKIKTINVPATYNGKDVVEIEKGALAKCPNLVNLSLPFIGKSKEASGTDALLGFVFGDEMYEGCGSFTWQEYESEETNTTVVGKYAIPSNLSNITISTFSQIAPGAFSNCKNIETINFETSDISEIGNKAFYNCSGLYEFDLSKLNGLKSIKASAFAGCYALESIVVPETVEEICDEAFKNCISSSSVVIPSNVAKLGTKALSNIVAGVILLQDSEQQVKNKISSGNWDANWTEETISIVYDFKSESSYKYVDDWLVVICGTGQNKYGYLAQWMGNWQQSNITVPGKVTIDDEELKIKIIGAKCLMENYYVKVINFEDGVESIYPNTFQGCSALTHINFPSTLKDIRSQAFKGCTSLVGSYESGQPTNVLKFNTGLDSIGDQAFYGCSSLPDITFNQELTTIGQEAFAHCSHLCPDNQVDTDHALLIPFNCTNIGQGAFKYCFKYAPSTFTSSTYTPTIRFDKGEALAPQIKVIPKNCFESCGVRDLKPTSGEDAGTIYPKTVRVNVDLNDSHIEKIDDCAFKNCYMNNLRNARYTHIEYIGDYAFYYARMSSDDTPESPGRQNLQMDQEIKYIGEYAFAYCNTIQSLKFNTEIDPDESHPYADKKYNSLEHLGQYAFYGCNHQDFTELDMSPCSKLKNYTKAEEEGVEPPYKVENTARYAFAGCSYLTIVKLPSIDGIGELKCTSFTRIPERMFESCTNLGKFIDDNNRFVIPSQITEIRTAAFNSCTYMRKCIIDGTISYLGSSAFNNCINVESIKRSDGTPVKFADSMDGIGTSIFSKCEKLNNPPIPIHQTKVSSLLDSNYYDNKALTSFTVPANINSINPNCFQACSSLETLSFETPIAEVTSLAIKSSAFSGCTCLAGTADPSPATTKTLDFSNTKLTSVADKAFEDCTSLTRIKLPNLRVSFSGSPFIGCSNILVIFQNKNTKEFQSAAWTNPETFTWYGTSIKFTKVTDQKYYTCNSSTFYGGSNFTFINVADL